MGLYLGVQQYNGGGAVQGYHLHWQPCQHGYSWGCSDVAHCTIRDDAIIFKKIFEGDLYSLITDLVDQILKVRNVTKLFNLLTINFQF